MTPQRSMAELKGAAPRCDEILDLVTKSFIERGRTPESIESHPDHAGPPKLIRSDTARLDRIIISIGFHEALDREVFKLDGGVRARVTQLWGVPIHVWARVD